MARMNVSVPDELIEAARRRHPSMNVSRVLQEALRSTLECSHERLRCEGCGAAVDRDALGALACAELWLAVMRAIEDLVWSGGTVEGAARVLRRVGLDQGVVVAARHPLPRLTRAERAALLEERATA